MSLFWVGEAYLRHGMADKAVEAWLQLATVDTGMLTRLADRLRAAGDARQAQALVTTALDLPGMTDSMRFPLYLKLADMNQWQDADAALRFAEFAVRIAPDNGDAHAELAWSLFELARYDDSIAAGIRALELGVSGQGTYRNIGSTYEVLGRALLASGNPARAITYLERSVAISPPWVLYPHIALGQAYLAVGRREEAVSQFTLALSISPENADAQCGLLQAQER